ncbi:HEPN domain-containing protein [bacterium D16-51]|nr:HEPN domain-containing protein [bacterium D16-59]RKI56592.1 HEPN domain-containing protein [bacterium D16-51]
MQNNELIKEWLDFADMDFQTVKYLYENMRPKPLEIICYHCQQAVEKLLKAVLIANGVVVKRTHDLGLLIELLQGYVNVEEKYLEICDNLTPYGVKIRYPQELSIEDYHAKKALEETEKIYLWLKTIIEHI